MPSADTSLKYALMQAGISAAQAVDIAFNKDVYGNPFRGAVGAVQ